MGERRHETYPVADALERCDRRRALWLSAGRIAIENPGIPADRIADQRSLVLDRQSRRTVTRHGCARRNETRHEHQGNEVGIHRLDSRCSPMPSMPRPNAERSGKMGGMMEASCVRVAISTTNIKANGSSST